MELKKMITAIYDCRSKQEYIYHTNKMVEISGASLLLSNVYKMFVEKAESYGIKIKDSWEKDFENGKRFDPEEFEKSPYQGEIIYAGGGNLNVIYKDKDIYIKANRIFSKMLLDETYSVSVVAACTETTDNFNADRKKLYREKNRMKNQGVLSSPCNVLPVMQIDRTTFMPVHEKVFSKGKRTDMTLESRHKTDAYKEYYGADDDVNTKRLDSLLINDDSSIIAVIYIDGNDMGNKISACTKGKDDYPLCVDALREFSINTDKYFVKQPIEAIKDCLRKKSMSGVQHKYRLIIGGGDEITIICCAEDAMDIVTTYFETLEKSAPLAKDKKNASCAGIAFFHSHMPFADVYKIAEECCESGKKHTRNGHSGESYIDFHYCHSGITNNLETLREEQEEKYTNRPYSTEDFAEFRRIGNILREIGRGNLKALGESIVKGDSYYQLEVERIKSRFMGNFAGLVEQYHNDEETLKKFIYDISVVYDLWFAGGEENVQTEN